MTDELRLPARSLLIHHPDGVESVALVPEQPLVIGRTSHADLMLHSARLSRLHARFEWSGAELWVTDLGSTHGTWVRGQRIEAPTRLFPDDELALGDVAVRVLAGTGVPPRLPGADPHDRFLADLTDELRRAQTFQRPTSLILIRPDAADPPLTHWLGGLRARLRTFDRLGLYGANLLELCLIEADAQAALELARSLRASPPEGAPPLRFGIASYPEAGNDAGQLLDAALRALSHTTADAPVQAAPPDLHGSPEGLDEDDLILRSPAMRALYQTASRVAGSRIPILITGETGTGKEMLARRIHAESGRAAHALHCLNCGALPESLVESILFGHEKGAFTGATHRKAGLFETARGGTILLDEIGEMPLNAQVALLRVLESGEFRRVGGHEELHADVRILAATHRNLEELVLTGQFREDLLYRINVMTLHLPPLRERTEEIPALAQRFIEEAPRELGLAPSLAPATLEVLRRYPWPGNVRELRNVIQRAMLVCRGARIEPHDLPERLQRTAAPDPMLVETPAGAPEPQARGRAIPFRHAVRACETVLIRAALRETNGTYAAAARALGLPRRTLSYKAHTYGIQADQPDAPAHLSILERLSRPSDEELPFRQRIARIEERILRAALQRADGDHTVAARELKLHPATYRSKREKYGL